MAAKEKKNTARAGALLLAAALVTTVLTSGTLAKYTETVDGTDTARVSLFDFTAEQVEEGTQELTKTGSTIDIFGTSADDTGVFGEDDTNGEKLVAPVWRDMSNSSSPTKARWPSRSTSTPWGMRMPTICR